MNRIFTIALLLNLFFSLIALGQTDKENMRMNGPVSKFRFQKCIDKLAGWSRDSLVSRTILIDELTCFNKDGYVTKILWYDENENIILRNIITRYEDNRIQSDIWRKFTDGVVTQLNSSVYDHEKKTITFKLELYEGGKVSQSMDDTFEMDGDGKNIAESGVVYPPYIANVNRGNAKSYSFAKYCFDKYDNWTKCQMREDRLKYGRDGILPPPAKCQDYEVYRPKIIYFE